VGEPLKRNVSSLFTVKMQEPKLPQYPEGHEFYGRLVEATLTDGWCYGAITQTPCPDHPEGCVSGDGFAVAPDGSYAGLVWWAGCPWEFEQIGESKKDKFFGIFEVKFALPVRSEADLAENFRVTLPRLRSAYERWKASKKEAGTIE
jgi:hypothetical protein